MNILVVDDEPGVRGTLSTLIGRAGHQVTAASGGTNALQCFADAPTPFDLIITDHNMPEMSGDEFVSKLRVLSQTVKVIVFSAHVSAENCRRYCDLHVEKVLTKPFGFKELIDILKGLAQLSAKAQLFWLEANVRDDKRDCG